jgi:hypothetical protein
MKQAPAGSAVINPSRNCGELGPSEQAQRFIYRFRGEGDGG